MGWLDAIGAAWPVVVALALIIWTFIVYHGDTRWQRREEAKKMQDTLETHANLLTGQNDKVADHNSRLERLEERDEAVLKRLDSIGEGLQSVNERLIRMETRWSDGRRRGDSTDSTQT